MMSKLLSPIAKAFYNSGSMSNLIRKFEYNADGLPLNVRPIYASL